MKQQRVSLTLPKKILEEAEKMAKERLEDRSTAIRELLAIGITEYRENTAVRDYAEGKLSLGKAAETAGVSMWRFIDLLKERKVPLKYDLDALKEEIEAVSTA
ncbi:UPF0175 family protein [Candidatus Woesearchaeota archaeon]|nr:UPF0175 family protein [Candidatus Woesearchaeota archaeon]